MPSRLRPVVVEALTQADGVTPIPVNHFADYFLVTIKPSSGATGSLSFDIKPTEDSDYEPIIDPSTNLTQLITFSEEVRSFAVSGYFASAIRITPTLVIGSYDVVIQQSSQLD